MTAWLVYSVIVSAFLAVAALGAEGLLKSARRPVRVVWFIAIALTIAFTVLAPFRSEPPATIDMTQYVSVEQAPVAAQRAPTLLEKVNALGQEMLQTVMLPLNRATDLAASAPASVNRGAQMISLAAAVIALIVLLTVYARSMRERTKWPLMQLLGKRVRVTPNVGPAVLGLAPPEIVVPRWVLLRNVEEQRLVLEHESEHVRANDPMLLMFACIAVACMPWNAALWFMWSRLRLAVELDCDRRVLKRGVQKPAYGQLLVELSSNRPWMSPAIPAFSWGTSHLEQRLVAMTARPQRFRLLRRVASGTVIATALLAASKAELPVPDQLQAMDRSHLVSNATLVSGSLKVATSPREIVRVRESIETHSVAQDTISLKKVVAPQVLVKKPAPRKRVNQDSVPRILYKVVPTDSVRRVTRKVRPGIGIETVPAVKRARLTSDSSVVADKIRTGRITQGTGPVLYAYGRAVVSTDSAGTIVMMADTMVMRDSIVSMSGGDGRVRIRGTKSLPFDNSPLIFLNGVVFTGSLDTIDQNTIESIEVIKGAAATNLYGAQAANGIISIKLKR